jgi:hypothetical protein
MPIECLETIRKELIRIGIHIPLESLNAISNIGPWLRTYKFAEPIPLLEYIDKEEATRNPVSAVTLLQRRDEGWIRYSELSEAFSGNFGTLFSGTRENATKIQSIFIKSGKRKDNASIHVEGVLQALSYSVLSSYGFPWAVPRVLDIARHPHLDIVFTIEKCPEAKLFQDYLQSNILWGHKTAHNDYILLSILSQLATYLAILEYELLLNHRDLTGSNVLMIMPTDLTSRVITLGKTEWVLLISHKTILIDFGFAALGSMPSRKPIVSAGDFFPSSDTCPKEGRDLFLFLASLWKNPLVRQSVTPNTAALFRKWLTQSSINKNWAYWMEGIDVDIRSLYLITINESFSNGNTEPLTILHDISREYPVLVSFPVGKRPPTPFPC